MTVVAVTLAGLAWLLSRDPVWALAVLVVATPCPLILATPIAIMPGIDLAARNGLIVKSGASIEQLGSIDIAVFDKTGTLTLGQPKVTEMVLTDPTAPDDAKNTFSSEDFRWRGKTRMNVAHVHLWLTHVPILGSIFLTVLFLVALA